MIAMFSNHFFNWTRQLQGAGHEIYWIDVYDSNTYVKKIDFVHQIIGWRYRSDYPGRYWIKKKLPLLNSFINHFNERDLSSFVEEKILDIRPDVVQSFVLQSGAYPLLPVMKKFPQLKWIYSAWGNDLYYRQQFKNDLRDIKETLPEIDYMFSDCKRYHLIALNHGFKGDFLGVYPGGGGYEINNYDQWMKPISTRKLLLIKGYQGKLGRCNVILEAISSMKIELSSIDVVVFAGNETVQNYAVKKGLMQWDNFVFHRHISHDQVLKLLGNSILYIGNCISDGTPNTLLEAIIMGAFPIQSNPGGAKEEIVQHQLKGLLISDPENPEDIKSLITEALSNKEFMRKAVEYNLGNVKPDLERETVRKQVLEQYERVQKAVKT